MTFIGGHPLGGAAVGGLRNARADLFDGRPWILTAPAEAPAEASAQLSTFVVALGSAVVAMTPDEHDRIVAFVSHLPQLAASALMHVVGGAVGEQGLALAGGGLVDTTRLASSPAAIWRDIAAMNADQIAPALDALLAALQSLRDDLACGDRLDDVFGGAAGWRDQLISRAQL
jgi:prephenate dehydrogenase